MTPLVFFKRRALDPGLAILPEFLFPDRDPTFQIIDEPTASFEGLLSMQARDLDQNRTSARWNLADGMMESDGQWTPFINGLLDHPLHFGQCHGLVCLIAKGNQGSVCRMAFRSGDACEDAFGATRDLFIPALVFDGTRNEFDIDDGCVGLHKFIVADRDR